MEFAVTDLPQPLSPTIATVSPRSTAKETPSTARLTPSGVRKCVCRFSTSRSAMPGWSLYLLGHARIERIAQPVAQDIDGEHRQRQEDRREQHDVELDLPERPAL